MAMTHRVRAWFLVALLLFGIGSALFSPGSYAEEVAEAALHVVTDDPADAEDRTTDHTPYPLPACLHPAVSHVRVVDVIVALPSRIGDPPLRPPSNA
ncbi:MAG: hypothetical protein U1F52_10280 [Burkholderiales bacterium]